MGEIKEASNITERLRGATINEAFYDGVELRLVCDAGGVTKTLIINNVEIQSDVSVV